MAQNDATGMRVRVVWRRDRFLRGSDHIPLPQQGFYSLAQAPAAPSGAGIVAAALTNDTTLRWTRGSEPDLAGYEVLWRDSTAPDWTHVIPVGDVTTATVGLAKDNVHFGIRAVDRDGHRSPVAYPQPVT